MGLPPKFNLPSEEEVKDYEMNPFYSKVVNISSHFNRDIQRLNWMISATRNAIKKQPGEEDPKEWLTSFTASMLQLSDKFKAAYMHHRGGEEEIVKFTTDDGSYYQAKKKNLPVMGELVVIGANTNLQERNFFEEMAFNYLVTCFEATLSSYLREMFRYSIVYVLPKRNEDPAKHQYISPNDVINYGSIDAIKEQIIYRRILAFSHFNIYRKLKYINYLLEDVRPLGSQQYAVDKFIEIQDIVDAIEIFERRNLHVHSRGIMNDNYNEKLQEAMSVIKSNGKPEWESNVQKSNEQKEEYKNKIREANFSFQEHGTKDGLYSPVTDEYFAFAHIHLSKIVGIIQDGLITKFVPKEDQAIMHKLSNQRSARME